ncbi:MAG TPA: DUF4097 family beta strand repeat-containing protein [Gemmatimonadales bacterium]|nr:DUF4097 family beta strand repeat-containing protein [Gemmatimonadales bacterium]
MRTWPVALGLAVVGHSLTAQQRIDRRFPIDADASIRIHHMLPGSVRVTGWERDTIVVTGTAAPGAFFSGGSGRGAKIGVEGEMGGGPATASHLEIRVPRRSRVWIKTASADIHAADVVGGLDLYSVSGGVRVTGQAGQVYAESMDGTVDVAAATRWVRVKTAAGLVSLRVAEGDVAASTVSGNIVVEAERLERARLESVTGDIHFAGDFDRGGTFVFETHGGKVELTLPPAVGATFDLSTHHGRILNQLTQAPVQTARDGVGKVASFEAGPGGADVTVRTFKGDVVVRRRL